MEWGNLISVWLSVSLLVHVLPKLVIMHMELWERLFEMEHSGIGTAVMLVSVFSVCGGGMFYILQLGAYINQLGL